MSDLYEERSNSIIETSLTELAFIFFFILLTVSAWKISTGTSALNASEAQIEDLEEEVAKLTESLSTASEILEVADEYDPEELFTELTTGREAVKQLESVLQEKELLQKELDALSEHSDAVEQLTLVIKEKEIAQAELAEIKEIIGSELSNEALAEQLTQFSELVKVIESHGVGSDPVSRTLELLQQYNDTKGQNINLRKKLAAVGNGLDHPPCWADPETGSIQYVFDVIINEDFVEFKAGWPPSRSAQALNNPSITRVPGVYPKNELLWSQTRDLYKESENQKCRHFVRVYDHAESKSAFKNYLLGVENHFYKYLSTRKHI